MDYHFMEPTVSREELDAQIEKFLAKGGKIKKVGSGKAKKRFINVAYEDSEGTKKFKKIGVRYHKNSEFRFATK